MTATSPVGSCDAQRLKEQEQRIAAIDEKIAEASRERLEVLGEVRQLVREVKAMRYSPPEIVRRAIEAVQTLLWCGRWVDMKEEDLHHLDLSNEWSWMQRSLSNNDFVNSVLSFDVTDLDVAPQVADFVAKKYFPDLLQQLPLGQSLSSQQCSEVIPLASQQKGVQAATSHHAAPALCESRSRSYFSNAVSPLTSTNFGDRKLRQQHQPTRVASTTTISTVGSMIGGSSSGALARKSRRSSSFAATSNFSRTFLSSKTDGFVSHPIDLTAATHGSQACRVYIQWAMAILREFFILRSLRSQRAEACQHLDAARSEGCESRRENSKVETSGLQSGCDLSSFGDGSSTAQLVSADNPEEVAQMSPSISSLPAIVWPKNKERTRPKWASDFSTACFVG